MNGGRSSRARPEIALLEAKIDRLIGIHLKRADTRTIRRGHNGRTVYDDFDKIEAQLHSPETNARQRVERRINEQLGVRCVALEQQLFTTQQQLNEALAEKQTIVRDHETLLNDVRYLSLRQKSGKMKLESYISELIDGQNVIDEEHAPHDVPTTSKHPVPTFHDGDSGYHGSPATSDTRRITTRSMSPLKTQTRGRSLPPIHGADRAMAACRLVFAKLDAVSILKCSLVCQLWRKAALHPNCWKNVTITGVVTEPQMKTVALHTTRSQAITFTISQSVRSGNEKGYLDECASNVVLAAKDQLLFLKVLSVQSLISDRFVCLAAPACVRLQTIIFASVGAPITAGVLWALGARRPPLTRLALPPVDGRLLRLDRAVVAVICRCWPTTMRQLALDCRHLPADAITEIGRNCVRLKKLEVFRLNHSVIDAVSSIWRHFRSLTSLTVSKSEVTPQLVIAIAENIPQLDVLNIVLPHGLLDTIPTLQTLTSSSLHLQRILHISIE